VRAIDLAGAISSRYRMGCRASIEEIRRGRFAVVIAMTR